MHMKYFFYIMWTFFLFHHKNLKVTGSCSATEHVKTALLASIENHMVQCIYRKYEVHLVVPLWLHNHGNLNLFTDTYQI